jgi:uncharacterized protein (DUF302 family)
MEAFIMKSFSVPLSVNEATERLKTSLLKKGFEIFADIDHRSNAQAVNLDMPDARVLLFGNPLAGTKLMQKDIYMSFDLPLRLAVIEKGSETFLLHQTAADYSNQYQVQGHPVLEKIESLFSVLTSELSSKS